MEINQLCQLYTLNVTRDVARSVKELEIEIVELQALAESLGNRDHIEEHQTAGVHRQQVVLVRKIRLRKKTTDIT